MPQAALSKEAGPATAGSKGVRAAGVVRCCGTRSCACGPTGDEEVVRPSSTASASAVDCAAPDSVRRALDSPGVALDADTRTFFETRMRHDFGAVRIHSGPEAAASAVEISARAYTVGNNIVLGPGVASEVAPGSRLLAHELTHVVQGTGPTPAGAPLQVGAADSPAEREAEQVAAEVSGGGTVSVAGRSSRAVVRRQFGCPDLIQPSNPLAAAGIGTPAHDAITDHARGVFGTAYWRQPIPTASFTPFRPQSQTIGGRAGPGTPDLGYRDNRIVELAEIKPAILETGPFGGLIEGEAQLLNYLIKGNSEENRGWRGRRRITQFVAMPSSRLSFPQVLDTASGHRIRAGWCAPGLIGYRALSQEEAETIICGLSDQGMIDSFLDSALDGAQRMVDSYVDAVGESIAKRIRSFTLKEALVVLSGHAASGLKKLVAAVGGSLAEAAMEYVPDVELTDWAADYLADALGGATVEELLRVMATQVKNRLLAQVRSWLKARIRTYLQEAFAAACAAAAVGAAVSVAELLRRFGQQLADRFLDGVVVAAKAMAIAVAKELAKSIMMAIVIVAAVALLIFFLPEILAGMAAVGEAVALGAAALGAAAPRIWQLLGEIVDAVIDFAPAL